MNFSKVIIYVDFDNFWQIYGTADRFEHFSSAICISNLSITRQSEHVESLVFCLHCSQSTSCPVQKQITKELLKDLFLLDRINCYQNQIISISYN